jgi:hypothetical protein
MQALVLAALCSVLFLGKALLPGYAVMPFPPEVLEPMRSEALAEGRVTAADLQQGNPSFGDKYNQSLAWDRITGDRLRGGDFPLWTRDIAGGAPFVPQQGQPYMPWSWLLPLIPAPGVYGLWYFLHQVVFAAFAYRFLRRIGTGHAAGLLGVVCTAIGLWTQARVHHNVILSAALPLFAMLSCAHELAVRRGGARAAGWLAIGSGVSWLGGLPQASLMISYVVGAYGLALALRQPRGERLRPVLWMGVAFALGGLIGLAQMGPTLLAAQVTSRAAATADLLAFKALEWDHLLQLVWPDLLTWPAEKWYPEQAPDATRVPFAALLLLDWQKIQLGVFGHPETACAIGVPALLLCSAGLGHRARRFDAWFFGAVAVLALGLALGVEPFLSLSAVLPGARAGDLKRFLFPFAMALSVLAALGMDRLAEPRAMRAPMGAAALVALASLALLVLHLAPAEVVLDRYAHWVTAGVAGVTPEQFAASANPGEAAANRQHLLLTFGRAAAMACAALALLAARRRRGAELLLVGCTAIELLSAGRGTIVPIECARVTAPPRILAPALEATRAAAPGPRPRFARLATTIGAAAPGPLLRPNLGAFFGLEDVAAYDPLPPRRMEEFFLALEPDAPGKRSVALGGAGVDAWRSAVSVTHPLADLLGVRFVLTDAELDSLGLADRTPAGYAPPFRLYERTTCLPRATFVARARVITGAQERLAALADRARDPRAEVILEDPAAPVAEGGDEAPATVEVTLHAEERVEISVLAPRDGYLRLADPWDAGWTATVDGAATPVYVADHYLRAVHVRAGAHRVVFRYDGPAVQWPRRLAALGVLGAVCLLAVGVRRRRG